MAGTIKRTNVLSFTNGVVSEAKKSGTTASGANDLATGESFVQTTNGQSLTLQNVSTSVQQVRMDSDVTSPGFCWMRNITSGQTIYIGRYSALCVLASPAAPTVTPQGTTGAASYGYKITAIDDLGETLPSTQGTTATGNATLNGTNFNRITWSAVTGAKGYRIYGRTTGGPWLLIGTVGAVLTYDDQTNTAGSGAPPAANDTGFLPFAELEYKATLDTKLFGSNLYCKGTGSAQLETFVLQR